MGQVVAIDVMHPGVLGQRPAFSPVDIQALKGRLSEVSGHATGASLSLAILWVLHTQQAHELAAWVQTRASTFYPPDAAAVGVDLAAFPVVTMADAMAAARAAETLLRAGALGLLVLDIGTADVSMAIQSRLSGLAQKHHTALVCLTEKKDTHDSLGSLVSFRLHASKKQLSGDRFSVETTVLKDKRRGPGMHFSGVFHGPAGLR
jgi:recombination protein RecA